MVKAVDDSARTILSLNRSSPIYQATGLTVQHKVIGFPQTPHAAIHDTSSPLFKKNGCAYSVFLTTCMHYMLFSLTCNMGIFAHQSNACVRVGQKLEHGMEASLFACLLAVDQTLLGCGRG